MLLEALNRVPEQFGLLTEAADKIALASQVVCAGVGKSSFVAQKLSASLASISVCSIFMHPAEALHGDIGIVRKDAVVVIVSKSGNSAEINAILPHLIKRSCSIIAICNRKESALGRAADIFLDISITEEGEPLNILPLMSIELSLVLADMLVARVSEIRGLTVDAFAQNHPGGQLGKNVSLNLDDLREWKARRPFVRSGTTIIEAILTESQFRAGMVCVVESSDHLIGVVTDGDIRRAIGSSLELDRKTVDSIMNTSPITLQEKMKVGSALNAMEMGPRKVFSAPVINDKSRGIGVVTLHDLI